MVCERDEGRGSVRRLRPSPRQSVAEASRRAPGRARCDRRHNRRGDPSFIIAL